MAGGHRDPELDLISHAKEPADPVGGLRCVRR
jgi:hypothetical protein